MTPEEALRNIIKLVEGSDELEDAHAMQILLQSIKTLAEKGVGAFELRLRRVVAGCAVVPSGNAISRNAGTSELTAN
jgi:hypothetical protein